MSQAEIEERFGKGGGGTPDAPSDPPTDPYGWDPETGQGTFNFGQDTDGPVPTNYLPGSDNPRNFPNLVEEGSDVGSDYLSHWDRYLHEFDHMSKKDGERMRDQGWPLGAKDKVIPSVQDFKDKSDNH